MISNQLSNPDIQEIADKPIKTYVCKSFDDSENRISQFCTAQSMSLDTASIQPELEFKILERNDLVMQIRSDFVCIFPGTNSQFHAKKRSKESEKNLQKKSYAGSLTESAVKKIKKKLDVWISLIDTYNIVSREPFQRCRSYITFLTLTLPAKQRHSDQEINRVCLTPFIDKLKYHFGVLNYFWRAERQENGNIHYHMLLDTYCDKLRVQELWNLTIDKLDYVTEFEMQHGHINPPSTMIKSLPKSASAIKYFVKYALKQDSDKLINGRVWMASKSILNLKPFTTASMISIMSLFKYLYDRKDTRFFEQDNNLLICFPKSLITNCNENTVISQYKQYLLLLYHVLYRDRHLKDKNYEFKQYYPLDFIDMNYLCNLRKMQVSQS